MTEPTTLARLANNFFLDYHILKNPPERRLGAALAGIDCFILSLDVLHASYGEAADAFGSGETSDSLRSLSSSPVSDRSNPEAFSSSKIRFFNLFGYKNTNHLLEENL